MPSSLFLPPLEGCFGTNPIQAEKFRPDRKAVGSATVETTAVAMLSAQGQSVQLIPRRHARWRRDISNADADRDGSSAFERALLSEFDKTFSIKLGKAKMSESLF
jgi:hypothetical protein